MSLNRPIKNGHCFWCENDNCENVWQIDHNCNYTYCKNCIIKALDTHTGIGNIEKCMRCDKENVKGATMTHSGHSSGSGCNICSDCVRYVANFANIRNFQFSTNDNSLHGNHSK